MDAEYDRFTESPIRFPIVPEGTIERAPARAAFALRNILRESMTMKRSLFATAVAAAVCTIVSVPAVAGDYTQLALAAGIRSVDVAAMSLDEIAAAKFSQESDDNRQAYVARASVGDVAGAAVQSSRTPEGLSLDEVHLNMINAGVSGQERQLRVQPGTTSDLQARLRLAASAGIPAAEAEGMSLSVIAAHKFNGDVRGDDRARIR